MPHVQRATRSRKPSVSPTPKPKRLLTEAERLRLREDVMRDGVVPVAVRVGVASVTIYRALADLPSSPGTIALIERYLASRAGGK